VIDLDSPPSEPVQWEVRLKGDNSGDCWLPIALTAWAAWARSAALHGYQFGSCVVTRVEVTP
jgi:hypothetical protein